MKPKETILAEASVALHSSRNEAVGRSFPKLYKSDNALSEKKLLTKWIKNIPPEANQESQ